MMLLAIYIHIYVIFQPCKDARLLTAVELLPVPLWFESVRALKTLLSAPLLHSLMTVDNNWEDRKSVFVEEPL